MKTSQLVICTLLCASAARAQDSTQAARDSATRLAGVRITAERDKKPVITRFTLPASATITAQRARETVNIVDTEDAVKYLPSVFLRKRNNGDTQATMATRVWGVSSSARSLIFADGVPITALIANNNTLGAPRWGLVAPEEIERIDMMYGPFSAAYAGNSMGAVMEITTRMPDEPEGSLGFTQALQAFDLYDTKRTYGTSQASLHFGTRKDRFAFWSGVNFQDSHSQPLSFVTAATFPTGTTGGFPAANKLGTTANVLGASGLLHTRMTNAKFKASYDLSPDVRATYTLGFWQNLAGASTDTYLTASNGATFAGASGFASGSYKLVQQHSSHSVSVRSDTRRDWDFEAIATWYHYDKDQQQMPGSAPSNGQTFGSAGRVAIMDGTGWSTLDIKGAWHAGGPTAAHTVSFGAHADRYTLHNPTHNTADWRSGTPFTGIATEGNGKTSMRALWVQDSWRIAPNTRFTMGGRYEKWRAYEGRNTNGGTTVHQPVVAAERFSPKMSFAYSPGSQTTITASLAKAFRFPTASELYQLVSTGTTLTSPVPDLKPDNVLASELRIARQGDQTNLQLALFNDEVHDAIVSQFRTLVPGSSTLYSFLSNVDHVQARGVEAAFGVSNLLQNRLEMSGSVTWLDAKTLATSGSANATATPTSAIGKRLPNIPEWRGNLQATYRPIERMSLTLAGRYSGILYTTLDNADINPNTWQGFGEWFVADTRANYRHSSRWSASLGVDNLFNRKYFLFHPFPHRTLVTSVRVGLP